MTGAAVTAQQAWYRDARAGLSVARVATKYGVSEDTVRRHISTRVSRNRQLAPGEEDHIDGQRGRWRFTGQVGIDGTLTFIHCRTDRTRFFPPARVTTIHRG